MFDEFRQDVKAVLQTRQITYRQLGKLSDMAEGTIKCFMSGATDSRRVAERIADAIGFRLMYQNGCYHLYDKEEN